MKKLKTPSNESMPFSSSLQRAGALPGTDPPTKVVGNALSGKLHAGSNAHGEERALWARRAAHMADDAPHSSPSPPKPPAGGAKEADDQGPVQSEDGGAKAGDGETGTSGGGEW